MGGHAAINFSWTVPYSIVIALQPQVTLDRSIVPWERRYPESINLDWSSPFGSLDGYNRAKNVYIFYDPLHELDNRQVSLLKGDSLIRCKCFFLGHDVPKGLVQMGLLQSAVIKIATSGLTESEFTESYKNSKKGQIYFLNKALYSDNEKVKDFYFKKAILEFNYNVIAIREYCSFLYDAKTHGARELSYIISHQLPPTFGCFYKIAKILSKNDIDNTHKSVRNELDFFLRSSLKKTRPALYATESYKLALMLFEANMLCESKLVCKMAIRYHKKNKKLLNLFKRFNASV